jgi:hypothetical protein
MLNRMIHADEALRLAVAREQLAHAQTLAAHGQALQQLAELRAAAASARMTAVLQRNRLDPFTGSIVTDDGAPYPLGTVLDAQGAPLPARVPPPKEAK